MAPGHTLRESHRHEGIVPARWWSLGEIETTCKFLQRTSANVSGPSFQAGVYQMFVNINFDSPNTDFKARHLRKDRHSGGQYRRFCICVTIFEMGCQGAPWVLLEHPVRIVSS